ncbi:MAG: magnesium transporter [Saprospiraceae bacterium]|nr:magnesium transporter [Saprospiraceae bacterium]
MEDLTTKHPHDIAEQIELLTPEEQTIAFLLLPGELESEVFTYFDNATQERILQSLGSNQIAALLETMPPDDRTRLFEDFPDNLIKNAVFLLGEEERRVALTLIGYPEDSVGRMMTPYYIQASPEWTVYQTLQRIKKFGKKAETLDFVYVIDNQQRLVDDIKIGKLLMAEPEDTIESLMDSSFVCLSSTDTKEDAIITFEKYDRSALPVISQNGVLVGIVTADDILDTIEERDTEDIQKFGGLEALDLPYVETPIFTMIRKRAGWLIILFLSEMLTASAMGYFEEEIQKAVVLALFIPLIISSGGNSGSQAATLIIRAMALQEITLRNWWFVLRKEILSGLALGGVLGLIGFIRILVWQQSGIYDYGDHWLNVALAVSVSLVGIVLWGTLSGSMIPFILKRFRLDPATSSAPFVATLVDVTGLIIYFSIAAIFLSGKIM